MVYSCLCLLAVSVVFGCDKGNDTMLKLKVMYYLNQEGLKYFPSWYSEVLEVSSQQDGFLRMSYENEENQPVVYLDFENQEKLLKWANTAIHDELADKLEIYFIKPQEVETQLTTKEN